MVFQCLIVIFLASHLSISTTVQASQDANCNTTCTYTDSHESDIRDADCNNRGLTSVPQGCSPSMKTMDLRDNELKSLGPESFRGYRQLQTLAMESNQISNITTGAFEGCVSLGKVYLQDNLLVAVGEGAFDGATALNGLYLNDNNIMSLHADAFRGLGNLQYLHIGSNDLQTLPQRIFDNLVRLTFLNLENNNLQSIDGTVFVHLVNLKSLILSGNVIVSITGFPTLPNLRTLDLFDNDLRDVSDVADKIGNLDEFYLAENDNIICTCSINPVCDWIKNHRLDGDASKVDVACREPLSLRGRLLHSLSHSSLCSTPITGPATGSALPWSTSKGSYPTRKPDGVPTTETLASHEYERQSGQEVASNEHLEPHAIGIYAAVGSGCLIVIVLTIVVLIMCLNYTTRRRQQRQPVIKQEQRQPQPRQGNQDALMMRITINRSSEDDDGAYELVRPDLHSSPTNDSAFGSQTDLAEVTEDAQAWQAMTHQAGADSSDSSFPSYPTYMSLDDWDATHPLPPSDISADEDFPTLAQERHATNPFLRAMPQGQAVPNTEGPSYQTHYASYMYVPHTIFSKMPISNVPKHISPKMRTHGHQLHPGPARKLPQSFQDTPKHNAPYVPHGFVHQANLTLGQTPDQIPEHTLGDLAPCKSGNPFVKSASTNPFISCP